MEHKIVFVAHCILNTASKVVMFNKDDMAAEEALRRKFLEKAIGEGIQIIQFPCPEFTLYGPKRWGHVSNQFDNVFFRKHCRSILEPFIDQLKEYCLNGDRFRVLGIVGVDGSPSCGVDYTCKADWYGSFEERENLNETLETCQMVSGKGVFMDELAEILKENDLEEKVDITGLFAPEPEKCLSLLDK